MKAEAIRALRKELGCTARELAAALGVEPEIVSAWELGEGFPTKQWIERLEKLRAAGPSAIAKRPRKQQSKTPMERLADPVTWALVRKILQHPALFAEVAALAERYDDPAGPQR